MEDPKFLRKRLYAILKAATWGFIVFAVITIAVYVGAHFWMHGRKGDYWPEFFWGMLFFVAAPTSVVQDTLGLGQAPIDSFVNSKTFVVIVNGVFGAVIFGLLASFWQFAIKGDPPRSDV